MIPAQLRNDTIALCGGIIERRRRKWSWTLTRLLGDIVETGGGANSLAPAGIPIGPIQSIRVGAGGENAVLTLRWAAAQVDLTTVVVVLYVPTLTPADHQS